MSCDSRRARAWKALAATGRVTSRVDSADAERLLRTAYLTGRAEGPSEGPLDEDYDRARTGALMRRMQYLTGEVPAHGKDDPDLGVPVPVSGAARHGYAASLDVLDQLEGTRPPTDPQVRLALGQHRYPGAEVTVTDLPLNPEVQKVIDRFAARGMSARPAGGAVRDHELGKRAKDVDVEVYGGDEQKVRAVLAQCGPYEEVGKAFGVFKLPVAGEDEPLDVSMPRKDSKSGEGHKGVVVEVDGSMDPREACKRRDLTFNAMLHDPEFGVTVDYFGGRRDLAEGRIRHVDESFRDDPLRAQRAARFAAVYDGRLEPETAQMCRSLKGEYRTLPEERIQGEWDKLVRGKAPQSGIRALNDMGWDEFTPELAAHREQAQVSAGRAVAVADRAGLQGAARAQHVYSGICAPMGPEAGRRFLASVGETRMRDELTRKIVNVVREQDVPRTSAMDDPQVRALARRLQPATVRDWARHQETLGNAVGARWAAKAETLGVSEAPEKRMVEGRDILPRVRKGVKPGPWTGQMVADAALAQENGEFRDREGARVWIEGRLRAAGHLD